MIILCFPLVLTACEHTLDLPLLLDFNFVHFQNASDFSLIITDKSFLLKWCLMLSTTYPRI